MRKKGRGGIGLRLRKQQIKNNQIIINLRFGVCKAPLGTQKEYEVSGVRKQNEDENFYKVRVGSRSRNDHHNNCFCRWSDDKLKPECIILA